MTFPQKGVLFPSQPKVAFVEVHITPDVFEDDARLSCLVQSIASVPVVVKPPFTPTPGGDESILSFAGRLSETLNPNDFALVFAVSTEKVSYFIPGPAPEGMTTFQERSSADGKHHFPKTGGDIFFHIKSGIQAEEKGSIDQMIYHIKEKLKAFSEHVYVRKAFNGASGRNQFGFFDGGSNPKVTANPVLPLGPYDKAYTKVIDVKNAFEKVDESIKKDFTTEEIVTSLERKQEAEKKELGKLVDLGSFHTSFIESGTHAGGSFIIWQEWQHNGLDKFNKLDETDQNNVFGRDKKTGGFLPTGKSHGGNNPPLLFGRNDPLAGDINKTYPNSHIVRTHVRMTNIHAETADVNPLIQNNPGASTAPLQITRQGSPFYDEEKGIKGLGFLAYAKDTLRYDQILDRMIGKNVTWPKKGDTSVDSLLNFSKPVRGGYFYVPNMLEINAMIQKVSYDVAIIGGGVSGLFSALRLKENDCNLKVAVFESDNHVGGRLVSIPAPQTDNRIITEFGGMRFPNKFHYTNKIVNELELETIEFPVDKDVNPFYVRGKNGKLESLKKPKRAKEIFNMRNVSSDDIDGGLFIPLLAHLGWNKEAPTDRLGRHELRTFLKTVRLDADGKLSASVGTGELLSEMSIHQLWMKVYGLEALKYQVAISGYFSPWGDWNAIDAIVDNLSDFGQDVKYFRLKDGYQSLVKKMTEKFRGMGGEVFLGKKLSSFSERGNNAFYLDFGEDNPLVASNLILAMPRKCLSSIESASLATPEVQKMIQSVKPKPFFKLFLCYERVWWDKSLTGRSITTLPIRQCYYWQIDEETGRAVIMFYDDGSNPEFWSAILDRDRDPDVQDTWEDNRVAENVKLEAHRQFAKLQGKDPESVPKPYAASCASWSGESKFGGGVNFWLPKVDSQKIIDAIIQPIPNARLFICGSAYSNYQGWVEGALETADCMLTKKFNLKPFLSPLDNLKIHVNNLSKKVDKVYFEMSVAKKEERSNEEDGQWKVIYKSEEKKVEKASASWDGLGVVLEAQAKKLSSGRTQDGDYSAVDNTPMKISFLLIKFGRFLPSSRKCKVQTYETTAHDLINKAQRADKLFKNSKITVEFTST